ncbi:hypothetical protein HPG69_000886, partial [Diceros bicornis minor]
EPEQSPHTENTELREQMEERKSAECGEYKGIIESVPGEKLQFEEGKLTEKAALAEKLRKCDIPIQDLAQELTDPVTAKIFWFPCHIWGHNRARTGGVGTERKNALENHEDEEDEEGKASLDPSLSREVPKKEKLNEVLKDSLDECLMTSSSHHDLSDSHQPPSTTVFLSDKNEDCSALDVPSEYAHYKENKGPTETQNDQKEEERGLPKAPSTTIPSDEHEVCSAPKATRDYSIAKRIKLQMISQVASVFFVFTPLSSRGLQEKEEMNDVCKHSLDEQCLTPSSHHDLSDPHHPPNSTIIPSDEHEVCSALGIASEYSIVKRIKLQMLSQVASTFFVLTPLFRHQDLLAHNDLDNYQAQSFQGQLAEGCRLAEVLTHNLSQENHEDEDEEQLESLTPRKYHFLIHDHAWKLTQIRQMLWEETDISVLLKQHLKDLLTHSDLGNYQGQRFQEQLAEGRRLAEHLARKLSPGKAATGPDCIEPSKFPGPSFHVALGAMTGPRLAGQEQRGEMHRGSLDREPQEEKVNEVLQDPLGEQYLTPSSPHDPSASGEPLTSTVFLFDKPKVSLALDAASEYSHYKAEKSNLGGPSKEKLGLILLKPLLVSAPVWETCQQGPLSRNMSFQRSEMRVSQAQLKPSTRLDQFHCGDGQARLGLSSTIWRFAANSDPGNQRPVLEGKKEKELGLDASLGMKKFPKLEDDALEGSAVRKHGCQVTDHINALSALKQRILERKLRLSK